MTINKKIIGILSATALLTACGSNENTQASQSELTDDGVLTVGVTHGPHEEILNIVQELASEEDFEIEIVSFNDYVKPNTSLVDGDLDINCFQTGPFLDNVVSEQGFELTALAQSITIPMGIYSNKYDDLSEINEGDIIGIPNSPTQEGRALQLLQDADLIELGDVEWVDATINDVTKNPLNLELIASEAAQLPVQLEDFDAAAINSNFTLDAGFNTNEDTIYVETDDKISEQANYIVSRTENKDDPAIQRFIELYQSEEVKQFIEEEYSGAVVPNW